MVFCNEKDWIANNSKAFAWYYSEYPELKEYQLPLPMGFLKAFYIKDMSDNHNQAAINVGWLNCYETLFSYFLGRISGANTFVGRTWYQLLIDSFPKAINKTVKDISNPFGVPLWLLIGLGAFIYLAKK